MKRDDGKWKWSKEGRETYHLDRNKKKKGYAGNFIKFKSHFE